MYTPTKNIFALFEIGSHYITLTGLKLTVDQPALELIEIHLYLPPEKRLEEKKERNEKLQNFEAGMVAHTFESSTWEAEADKSL